MQLTETTPMKQEAGSGLLTHCSGHRKEEQGHTDHTGHHQNIFFHSSGRSCSTSCHSAAWPQSPACSTTQWPQAPKYHQLLLSPGEAAGHRLYSPMTQILSSSTSICALERARLGKTPAYSSSGYAKTSAG